MGISSHVGRCGCLQRHHTVTKLITLRYKRIRLKLCSFKKVVTILSLLTRYSRLLCAARVAATHEEVFCYVWCRSFGPYVNLEGFNGFPRRNEKVLFQTKLVFNGSWGNKCCDIIYGLCHRNVKPQPENMKKPRKCRIICHFSNLRSWILGKCV